jgi:hypothetical protein
MYYKDYLTLEIHFGKSHFLCPYEECKSKCYVAFKSESEMISHINILHKKSNATSSVINANALLGFGSIKEADEEEKQKYKGQKRDERPKL